MDFKEGGHSKRVLSERERKTQRESLKDGARVAKIGTRDVHTVEG